MPRISHLLVAAFAATLTFNQFTRAVEGDKPTAVMLSNKEFRLPPNSKWREERIMSAPRLKLQVDFGADKSMKGTMSMRSRQLMDVEVATEKDVRLEFLQCESSNDVDLFNNRSKHTRDLPLDGKMVIAQRTEKGRWIAKLDSRRKPTPGESSALYALSHLWSEGIYPDKEVEIGQTWKIEASEFKSLFGNDFERPEGDFEFTLARMVEHEGQTCAKITGKGKFRSQTKGFGSPDGEAEEPLTATMDITLEIFRSIDLAMDLTVNMSGTLDIRNDKAREELRYKATSPVEFSRTFRKR